MPQHELLDAITPALIAAALAKLDEWKRQLAHLDDQIAQIEQQGHVNAALHWRDGKYLYLIYP